MSFSQLININAGLIKFGKFSRCGNVLDNYLTTNTLVQRVQIVPGIAEHDAARCTYIKLCNFHSLCDDFSSILDEFGLVSLPDVVMSLTISKHHLVQRS